MAMGAVFLIESGTITPSAAFAEIDFRVLGFLFGMFTVVTAMEVSGVLEAVARRILALSTTLRKAIFTTVFGTGLLSAILVNDTIALLWTPVVVGVSAGLGVVETPLLIALAFGITIGSTMTPIGNPQNLLVAENSGMNSPMTTFLYYLGVPTIINLFLTALIISLLFPVNFRTKERNAEKIYLKEDEKRKRIDPILSKISTLAIALAVSGFFLASFVNLDFLLGPQTSLTLVALVSGGLVYCLSSRRKEIFLKLDWSILVFFASMFVLMGGVWDSGVGPTVLQFFGEPSRSDPLISTTIIMAVSTILSQILSNVPFVQLYSRVLIAHQISGAFPKLWLALAAGSTIAGNLTVLGAASNIIIIEAAERRKVRPFSFFEFLKIGSLVTMVNLVVYFVFLFI
jgi:Na+/H+ antiporter NhaD/arsenite permease-like protein